MIERVFIVHHSHTDIGYTDPQEVVLRLHADYLDRALELCAHTSAAPPEARFRWTCEAAGIVEYYLKHRSAAVVEQMRAQVQREAVEITAMAWNLTPLPSAEEVVRSLYAVQRLRHTLGTPVRCAMQGDVNGLDWWFADLLPAVGVPYLLTAINATRGRAPLSRPRAFWWEGPAGGRVLAFIGEHYHEGSLGLGLGRSHDLFASRLDGYQRRLAAMGYPLDFLCFQYTNDAKVDNGGPEPGLTAFVQAWNEAGRQPPLEIALPSRVFTHLEERFGSSLEVWRGDWTDWWADGVASSAAEVAVCRHGQGVVAVAERLAAFVHTLDPNWAAPQEALAAAYRNLTLFGEHTWGAHNSVSAPQDPFVQSQWHWKAGRSHDGTGLAEYARRKAEAALQAAGTEDGAATASADVLVFNACPFPVDALVSQPTLAGREIAVSDRAGERCLAVQQAGQIRWLCKELPPLGYRCYWFSPRAEGGSTALTAPPPAVDVGYNTLGNRWYQLTLDPATGAIASFVFREIDQELVDGQVEQELRGIGRYVYERVAGGDRAGLWQHGVSRPGRKEGFALDPGFHRATAGPFRLRAGQRDALGASLVAEGTAPGCRRLQLEVALSAIHPWVELTYTLDKEDVTEPEAVYVAFPFAVPEAVVHLEIPGGYLQPERDQLPGTCRDWYSVQRWVDVSGPEFGVTLLTLDAPLVQVGGITTNGVADHLEPAHPATVVSWALHNHWFTNFRASQGGRIVLRYRIIAHLGGFAPAAADRAAMEAMLGPSVVPLRPGAGARVLSGLARDAGRRLQATEGSLLRLEGANVSLLAVKPAEDGRGLIVRLLEVAGKGGAFSLRIALPGFALEAACDCTHLEEDRATIPLEPDGALRGELSARQMVTLRLFVGSRSSGAPGG